MDPNNVCQHCRRGNAEFAGWKFVPDGGHVYQVYRCTNCGRSHERAVPYHEFDIEHPGVRFTMLPVPELMRRIGLNA